MPAQPRIANTDANGDDLGITPAERIEQIETRQTNAEKRLGRLEIAWAMVTGGGIVVVAVIGYAMWIAERLWK